MPVNISATQLISLLTDSDGDGVIDPGDILRFAVTIANSGDTDALGVSFEEFINLFTLVPDTLNISPLAFDESYAALGNVELVVNAANGLLTNDVEFLGDSFTIDTGSFATDQGGTITIAADGSFTYTSALGFSGAEDSFDYTIRDDGSDGIAGNADDLTGTGTVTFDVGPAVWFVDNNAGGSTNAGTQDNPFTSIADFNTANNGAGTNPAAGDYICLRQGTGSYSEADGVNLLNGQILLGGGVNLVVNHASAGNVLVESATGAPTISASAGDGVNLAQNNTLGGFTIGNTSGTGIVDGNGTVGTLTIANVSITGNGKAVDIDQGGTLNVTFDTLSSASSATEGVHLQGVSGSFTANSGIIQTSTGQGFLIGAAGGGIANSGGNANITYGGQISNSGGAAVDIQDRTGGTVTFSNNITEGAGQGIVADGNAGTINFTGQIFLSTGGSNAVTLTNNSATIAFGPTGNGLDITTTTGNGFIVDTGGGTVTLTGSGNTVQTTSGRAVEIDGVTIGGAGVTFASVGVSNGTSNTGIYLNNAGSGGFTISGTGSTAGSGGTINSIDSGADGNAEQGIGIYIENTHNISLSNLAFTGDFANFGIRGTNVNNFTLRDSTANSAAADNGGFGNSNAADEGVVSFDNLTGTALFTGNNLSDGHEDIIVIENTSGTLNLTVNDSAANGAVIGRNGEAIGSATGNDGILVTTTGSAALTMNVTGVVFEGWRGDGIQTDARGASTHNITLSNNTFHNGHLDIVSGGGGISLGLSVGTGAGPSVTYAITGNSFRGAEGNVINLSAIGPSGAMSGTVLNNTIGNNNGVHNADQANTGSNSGGSGIFVRVEKDDGGGTLTNAVRIEGNNIGDIVNGIGGIHLLANGGVSGNGTARVEATIRNNVIDENGLNIAGGIYADIGGAGGNDAARMGLNIENNTINMTGSNNAIAALVFGDLTNNAQYYFPGYGGPYTDAGLAAFHTGAEGNTLAVSGFVQQVTTAPTGTFATGNAFVLPVASPFRPLGMAQSDAPEGAASGPPQAAPPTVSVHGTAPGGSETYVQLGTKLTEEQAAAIVGTKGWSAPETRTIAAESNDLFYLAGQRPVAEAGRLPSFIQSSTISPISIGTLPDGKSVVIQWHASVDGQSNQLIVNPSNQGTVAGDNFSDVLTDDPGVGGAADPNVSAIDSLTLGNLVFNDLNGNGVFDGADSGIGGVTLTLYADDGDTAGSLDANDTQLATATSEINGSYTFAGLAEGDYIVVVDAANFQSGNALEDFVSPTGGTDPDDNVDNDDNGVDGAGGIVLSGAITLNYNAEPDGNEDGDFDADTNLTLDFAFTQPNQPPISGNLDGDSVTWTEGQALAALLDAGSNSGFADSDSANFDGGSLTVEITGGLVAAEDRLVIRLTGTVSFNATGVFVNGTQIATYTGHNTSGPLVFTFDADATPSAVAELARAIAYNNVGGNDPTDGNRTITWTLVDGDGNANGGDDTLTLSTTVDVDPINDAPAGADDTIGIVEDTAYTFSAADFGFTDPAESHAFAGVVLTTLPLAGDLYLNGVAITIAGTFVTAADIAANLLTYQPDLDGNGDDYASFTFQVRDDGGTDDGGQNTDQTPNTITIDVAPAGEFITGDNTDELLVGSNQDDTILGNGGHDTIFGYLGGDSLDGGGGNDRIVGRGGSDTMTGLAGNDKLSGGSGSDTLLGGANDDRLRGGRGADDLDGGDGTDWLLYMSSEAGVSIDLANDIASGGNADGDTIANFERVVGSNFADSLTGSDVANVLKGAGGDDTLSGGDGNDRLIGGAGADERTGGLGRDWHIFLDDDKGTVESITDFLGGEDSLDLSQVDANEGLGGNQAFTFFGDTETTTAGALFYEDNLDGTYTVFAHTDGDGIADLSFVVTAAAPLVAGDFVL